MRHVVSLGSCSLALALAGAVAVACGDANTTSFASSGGTSSGSIFLDDGGTIAQNIDGGAGTGTTTGLPCDVQKVLEDGCIGCHGGSTSPRLLTYADLTAPSTQYAGQTVAQRSLARMQAGTMPPKPAVPPNPAEVTTFSNWVQAGAPKGGTCTSQPDGGGGGNTNTPPVCTSGKNGSTSSDVGVLMDPGRACLVCHQQRGGPRFSMAGTVYPTAHEPDMCIGIAGLQVVATDTAGATLTMTVNSAGNFCADPGDPKKCQTTGTLNLVPPFSVKVVNPTTGATRPMGGTITSGDCNVCHSQNGANGAPGRIFQP